MATLSDSYFFARWSSIVNHLPIDMHSRFYVLTQAFRSSRPWARAARPTVRHRISQYVCKSCRHNFSTSSILRKTAEVTKNASKQQSKRYGIMKITKLTKVEYPRQLVIYDAGEMRSTFVVFWKATAIFQFGVACVWFAPLFYKNENQPDKDVRLLQTVGSKDIFCYTHRLYLIIILFRILNFPLSALCFSSFNLSHARNTN
jgi:hypothetical protein